MSRFPWHRPDDYHNRCTVVHDSTRRCVRDDNHPGKHMFWATGGDQVVFRCPTHDKFVTNGADDRDFCPWCQIDKLESLLSPESDPTPEPYRMAEPTKIGASVISDGTVFTRTDNSDTPWRQHHDLGLAPLRWDWIRSPLPFQNCVITANDPELPVGSVVWDADCGPYERINGGMWVSTRTGYKVTSADLSETPVTLLYRGDA